jgi:hypothetical protein
VYNKTLPTVKLFTVVEFFRTISAALANRRQL